MKHLFRLLVAAVLALPTACGNDPADPETPLTPVEQGFSLSATEVELAPGATATVDITVTPSDLRLDADRFTLTTAEGGVPEHVCLQSIEPNLVSNSFRLTLRDLRSASTVGGKYVEKLQIGYPDIETPQLLTARNVPYLPIVYVTTPTEQSSITKETWVSGTIEIDGGGRFDDLPQVTVGVKGRGNSTWYWEKKPYALKFDKKQPVLGMPKHKRWCLIANYMDRTHLRNRVAYHLGANSRLAYTTRNEYAELYFNGRYQGLYLLTEQIKVDENRVAVAEPTDGNDTAGYLIEMDTNYDEDVRFRSATTNIPVNLKFPDAEDISAAQLDYIRQYVNRTDEAVAAAAQGKTGTDPFELLDREAMIDFWLVFEIMANHEILHPKSIYFHKDRNGKLTAGPVWDFDYATLTPRTQTQWINYGLSYQYNEFAWYEKTWWNQLLTADATLRADVRKRWQEWYPFLQSVPQFMEREAEAIAGAEARNLQVWPRINGTGNPNGDESLPFRDAVKQLEQTYTTRIQWMNDRISRW